MPSWDGLGSILRASNRQWCVDIGLQLEALRMATRGLGGGAQNDALGGAVVVNCDTGKIL